MQFEAKVGEHGEIKIPDGVRAELQLKPDAAIISRDCGGGL